MKKRHLIIETLFFTMAIIGISFQVSISILFTQANVTTLTPLIENWSEGPIKSLSNPTYANEVSTCANNSNVLNQTWKGTYPGIIDYFGTIIPSSSSNAPLSANANSIPQLKEHVTNKWRKHLLCGKRMKAESYFDLTILQDDKSKDIEHKCPFPMKYCGIVDSMGNILCLNDSKECPINYIQYTPGTIPPEESILQYSDGFIYYTNEAQESRFKASMVLKDIIFSEGIPCIDTNYINDTSAELHPLDYHYTKHQCPFPMVNKAYVPIDSYSKQTFYDENTITKKLLKLPGSTGIDKSAMMNLYIRSYIGLKYGCLIKLDDNDKRYAIDNLKAVQYEVNKAVNWNTITIVIDIFFMLLYIVKYLAIVTKSYFKKGKKPKYVKPLLMITSIFSCIFTCISFASLSSYPIIDIISDKQCLDENTNMLISNTLYRMRLAKTFLIVSIVVKGIITLKYGVMTAIKYAS